MDSVRKCLEFYEPGGIAWDMSWEADRSSSAYPESHLGHGILRVQAEIYKWLKEKYPEKSVVTKFGQGTPSQLFCDATMIEGGLGTVNKEIDFDIARSLNGAIYNAVYPYYYGRETAAAESGTIASLMKGLSLGAVIGVDASSIHQHLPGCPWKYGAERPVIDLGKLGTLASFSAQAAALPRID